MKKITKILTILLCVVVSMSAFIGCGGGAGGTLTVVHYRSEDAVFYEWMVEQFEEEYDCEVQLDLVSTDGWGTLLEGKLRGNAVDVYGIYPGSVYRDDATLPFMMDLSDMDFVDKLTDEYVDYATYTDGKIYSAPLNQTVNCVFYNKDIFEEYNLQVPTTYSEFISICNTLADHSADHSNNGGAEINGVELKAPILFGGRETWPITMTLNSIEASVVRAQDPDFYIDLFKNGTKNFEDDLYEEVFTKYRKIASYYQANPFGLAYSRVPVLFASGAYGMLIDGSWSYSQIMEANPDANIGVFILPANDSAEYKNYVVAKPASGFAIHKDTPNADLAKKFIEFQYREDIYEEFLDKVKMGSVLKDVQNPEGDAIISELFKSTNVNVSPLSEYLPSCVSYPHSICEKLALEEDYDGADAAKEMENLYKVVKASVPSLLDRWMALYNKGYTA